MRFVHLNMTYTDNLTEIYNFSHIGDMFHSQEHIIYMWTKVFLKSSLSIEFIQDNKEFSRMEITNSEKSVKKSILQKKLQSAFICVKMYLNNEMKMFVEMDLPKITTSGKVLMSNIDGGMDKFKVYIKWK